MVSARFKCSRVTPLGAPSYKEGWGAEVEYTPDYAGGKNRQWSEATPSGVMRLTVTNKDALAAPEMQPGAEVEILIGPVPD